MKIVQGERLDVKESVVNCAGCYHKVGKVCSYYHAVLQSNQHRPTYCTHWEPKKEKKDD